MSDPERPQVDDEPALPAPPAGEPPAGAPAGGAPAERDAEEEEQVALGLSKPDRFFLLVMGSVILILMSMQFRQRFGQPGESIERHRLEARQYEFQIQINRATWVEWMQLEGIGEVLGRRIVEDREERGPFRSVDDVQRVSGIGPKTMVAIRPHLACRDCESSQ